MITTVNPTQVILPILALTQTGEANGTITSGTVRVFQVTAGAEVNVLAATALVNIAGSRWAYAWAPTSLAAGQYIVEYALTDGAANYLSQDDLVVLDIATATAMTAAQTDITYTRNIVSGGRAQGNNQMIIYGPDGVTPLRTFNTFNAAGLPANTDIVRTVPV
jgi:hypothetical protein